MPPISISGKYAERASSRVELLRFPGEMACCENTVACGGVSRALRGRNRSLQFSDRSLQILETIETNCYPPLNIGGNRMPCQAFDEMRSACRILRLTKS